MKRIFRPTSLASDAFAAGFDQWRDHPREWPQGMTGYGQRFGSHFGHSAIKHTIIFGVGALRHEDPRRERSLRSGFWPRTKDAIHNNFIVRTDTGGHTLAVGRLAGDFGSAFISRTWYPDRLNTVPHSLSAGATSVGLGVGTSILHEFWPDIRKRLKRP